MHFAYSVAGGNATSGIAATYGVLESTLLKINGITDPKNLHKEQILDVPQPACPSSISNTTALHRSAIPQLITICASQMALSTHRTGLHQVQLQCKHVPARLHCGARQGMPSSAAMQWNAEAWTNGWHWLRIHNVRLQWLFQQFIAQHTYHPCS